MAHITYHYEGRVIPLAYLSRELRARGVKGASKSNLSRIFSGQRDPKYSLLKALAAAWGADLGEMGKAIEHCRGQYAERSGRERA